MRDFRWQENTRLNKGFLAIGAKARLSQNADVGATK